MFSALEGVGIDLVDVFQVLETEGIEKFEAAWNELLESVGQQLDLARSANGSGPVTSRKSL